MIRALASLIVVCLVAATGVRPLAARQDQHAARSVPREALAVQARLSAEMAPRRAGSQAPELAAIAVASPLVLAPPTARPASPLACRCAAFAIVPSAHRARGPPIV